MRHELRRWLVARGAGDQEVFDVTVAVQEACANAVEHAYRPGPEAFALEATASSGSSASWSATPAAGARRGARTADAGMLLMSELMDSVDIRHTERGTEVVLERTLGRSAA